MMASVRHMLVPGYRLDLDEVEAEVLANFLGSLIETDPNEVPDEVIGLWATLGSHVIARNSRHIDGE